MTRCLLILLFFISNCCTAQELKKQLQQAEGYDECLAIVEKDSTLRLELLQLNAIHDSAGWQLQCYLHHKGDVFEIDHNYYKVLFDTSNLLSRVNYIFLDGNKKSKASIDSTRHIIIDALKNNTAFEKLFSLYNMDGSKQFGDTYWFTESVMVKEFADAVLKHEVEDVFTVDVTGQGWFYVVLKTYPSKLFRQMELVKIYQDK